MNMKCENSFYFCKDYFLKLDYRKVVFFKEEKLGTGPFTLFTVLLKIDKL
jgi:hypothetical protein